VYTIDALVISVLNSCAVIVPVTVKLPATVPVEPLSEYKVNVDPVLIAIECEYPVKDPVVYVYKLAT
jgi:hypothetical protein